MNNKFYCGIDVSKKKLDVMLLVQEKYHYKVVENSNDGVIFLQEWIKSKLEKDAFVHFCMEATNVYHELLAFTLLENKNYKVSVVNPRIVKSYAKSLVKTKNDKTDAKILAEFNLVELKIMQKVRLQTFNTEAAARVVKTTLKSIEDTITENEKEIKFYYDNFPELKKEYELLNSIPSFGKRVSNVLISEIYKDEYGLYNPKKLTAFFGLEVREMESGTSVWSKPRITKFGNPRVRNMLYMAALVAIRHNTKMSDFYLRLVNKGKPKKLALIAVARKLLVVACAILNSQKPYDENHISCYNKNSVKIA